MAERRLVLYSPDGAEITYDPQCLHEVGRMDLSDLPNANAAAQLLVMVEERCNLGAWHDIGSVNLPCWADDDWKKGK